MSLGQADSQKGQTLEDNVEMTQQMYKPLLSEVRQSRNRSAVFYKVDLHVHSHESDDFPRLGDKPGCASSICEDSRSPSAGHFVQAGTRAGLRLMAVTDHNRSQVAEEIVAQSRGDLIVLPGMEVSLKTHLFPDSVVHVLAIFPEKHRCADIERVFGTASMPIYAERRSDSILGLSVQEFVSAVHTHGGLCIASHVNSDKGIRFLFRNSNAKLLKLRTRQRELERRNDQGMLSEKEKEGLREMASDSKKLEDAIQNQYLSFLVDNEFDAIEVECSTDRQFYSGTHIDDLGIRPICCMVGSDAHNLSDIGLKGYTTYVKMTCPGFADLQKALCDPGTRIRFEDDVPRPQIARILGVQFEGGFFQDCTIGFSDNLTCLIGARGCGKSAIIEALRYVFCRPTSHLHKDKQNDIQARLAHTVSDAAIKVVFVDRGGDTYVLKRWFGEPRTVCYEPDGTALTKIDVAVASNLQVKILGWGEIEELARSKREQLSLIDGFVPEADEAKHRIQDLLHNLKNNTAKVVALAKDIKELLPRVAELPTKQSLLEKLDSEILNELLRDYDRNQQAQRLVETIRLSIVNAQKPFLQDDGMPFLLLQLLLSGLEQVPENLMELDWWQKFETDFRAGVVVVQERYQDLLTNFGSLVELVRTAKDTLDSEAGTIEGDVNRAVESESSDVKSMLSKRKTLTEEVNALKTVQNQIDKKYGEMLDLMKDRWERTVPDLEAARDEVTQLRGVKLEDINAQLQELTKMARITLSLRHQEERTEFVLALGTGVKGDPDGVLKKVNKHYIADKYAEMYAKRHSTHSFVQAVLDDTDQECAGLCISVHEPDGLTRDVIPQDRAVAVKNHLHPRLESRPYLDPDKLEKLLSLEHCHTEDLIQICLEEHPIEGLSPGQRCSALIPIILLESDCPLIMDQPEDNLDNKLVFNLVVDIVRGLKERRQIIVATHNPNIPVSGDAEQIVVPEARSLERCDRVIQGSIDCDDIVDQVKAIMEGSEEAFRIRAQKYGYKIPAKPVLRV